MALALPLDVLDHVSAQAHTPWHTFCALQQVAPHFHVTKDDALWAREFEQRFGKAPEGESSPSRVNWQRRFSNRHRDERAFLHGNFGRWSRDGDRGKVFAVRVGPSGDAALAAFECGRIAAYGLGASAVPGPGAGPGAQLLGTYEPFASGEPADRGKALCVLDSGLVFGGYGDGSVLGWDRESREPKAELVLERTGAAPPAISGLAPLPGNRLVASSADACVRVWDTAEQKLVQSIAGQHGGAVSSVRTQGEIIYTASQDRYFRLFDLRTGPGPVAAQRMADWCLAVCPAAEPTKLWASDKAVKLFDTRQLGAPERVENPHKKLVSGFAVDRLRLVSCGLDGKVQAKSFDAVWAPAPARELCAFADYVLAVDFHERTLVCGTVQGTVEILEL